jgi:hypothetical protein
MPRIIPRASKNSNQKEIELLEKRVARIPELKRRPSVMDYWREMAQKMDWSFSEFLVLAAASMAGAISCGTKDDVEHVVMWAKRDAMKKVEAHNKRLQGNLEEVDIKGDPS